MTMSAQHSKIDSPMRAATAPASRAPTLGQVRRPALACRWEQSLLLPGMVERSISPDADSSPESNAAQSSATHDTQQTRLKPVIADWIEVGTMLIIAAVMTVLCASLV